MTNLKIRLPVCGFFGAVSVVFVLSLLLANFFELSGKDIFSHITGVCTLGCCMMATGAGIRAFALSLKTKYEKKIFKIIDICSNVSGLISFIMLGAGYCMYLWFDISPSSFTDTSHAASSMLFDTGTSLVAFSFVLSKLIDYLKKGE